MKKSLTDAVEGVGFFRQGLTPKCKQYTGKRLAKLTRDGEETSDHCPATVVLEI